MQHKSGNKTRKRNKRSKVSYGKTSKSKSNTLTRRNKKKYKTYKTYKIYRGGVTPVGSPRTPRGSVTTLTPGVGSKILTNTTPTLASVAQQLQTYAYKDRVSPYHSPGKRVVPVTELPGMGRDARLSHGEKIHSTGDKFTKEEMNRVIKSPLNRVSPIRKSRLGTHSFAPSVVASNVLPPPAILQATAPPLSSVLPSQVPTPPPEILLNSKGQLQTTYTPDFEIIDPGARTITTSTGLVIPHYYILPGTENPSEMSVTLPLSYIPTGADPINTLSQTKLIFLNTINIHNQYYYYLSPNIYSVLANLKLEEHFGTLLIWGRLFDELIDNIRITSIRTIQSRTLFDEENAKLFLSGIQNLAVTNLFNMGPSPSDENRRQIRYLNVFKIPKPTHPPSPTSLQLVGYNTHPMFRGNLSQIDVDDLLNISEHNPPTNIKENVFVIGHGAMRNELSPEMKFLANKYIRLIEIGKKHGLLSAKYPKFYFHLNNLMSDPSNAVMFNNTDKGEKKRKQIFDILCQYLTINQVSGCLLKDTFKLTDITHDREIEGHFDDADIQEDHSVTISTLMGFYSMGIFIPVDYTKNKAKTPIYKKKLFQLFPGTTFFTKNTKIGLVNTLLPMAVRNNKVINVILFSCAVEYAKTDVYYENPDPSFAKPSKTTPEMEMLIQGKSFIYNLGRMISTLLVIFDRAPFLSLTLKQDDSYTYNVESNGYYFSPTGQPYFENIERLTPQLLQFFNSYFVPFLTEIAKFNFEAVFSFAGIKGANPSHDLIDSSNPISGEPHANELRKVKIYLMDELYHTFHKISNYYVVAFNHLFNIYNQYINVFTGNTQKDIDARTAISQNIGMTKDILDFFSKIYHTILFISRGKYGVANIVPPISASFLIYPIYIETRKEYDETKVKKIYDEINEGMDYRRYEIINPKGTSLQPFPGKQIRGLIKNPPPPGGFFHTARSTYEYKEQPNINEAKERRLEDKHNLYEKQNIRTLARKVRAKGDYNISV